ncbi:MAG TPA: response regulator SirA [Gammaproteobacteria bacterium]|nr:response regulator SirA [Gammaproteobacteria bacterium]|tara:strand:+ start:3270 stop:3521 length:252 start_codon:yes stop_codon:yes gene_type:complete
MNDVNNNEAVRQLDTTGLMCPMPLLKTKQALNAMEPGAYLEVRATDPGSVKDFEVFTRQSGHLLLSSEVAESGVFVYRLQKKQ